MLPAGRHLARSCAVGHAHLYERYTRTMKADGRQIPYMVAGNGGYYNLSKLKTNAAGKKPTPGQQTEPDGQGNTITLEQFNDTNYGFLRITVNATTILVEALTVSSTPDDDLATPRRFRRRWSSTDSP